MTVTFFFKIELLQNDEKKKNENWYECILIWWNTNKTEINLSHIWIESEQNFCKMRWNTS